MFKQCQDNIQTVIRKLYIPGFSLNVKKLSTNPEREKMFLGSTLHTMKTKAFL